jgi:hypothetical protein
MVYDWGNNGNRGVPRNPQQPASYRPTPVRHRITQFLTLADIDEIAVPQPAIHHTIRVMPSFTATCDTCSDGCSIEHFCEGCDNEVCERCYREHNEVHMDVSMLDYEHTHCYCDDCVAERIDAERKSEYPLLTCGICFAQQPALMYDNSTDQWLCGDCSRNLTARIQSMAHTSPKRVAKWKPRFFLWYLRHFGKGHIAVLLAALLFGWPPDWAQ